MKVEDALKELDAGIVAGLIQQETKAHAAFFEDKTKSRREAGILCEQAAIAWLKKILLLPEKKDRLVLLVKKAIFLFSIAASHLYQDITGNLSARNPIDHSTFEKYLSTQAHLLSLYHAVGKLSTIDDAIILLDKVHEIIISQLGAAKTVILYLAIANKPNPIGFADQVSRVFYDYAIKALKFGNIDSKTLSVVEIVQYHKILECLWKDTVTRKDVARAAANKDDLAKFRSIEDNIVAEIERMDKLELQLSKQGSRNLSSKVDPAEDQTSSPPRVTPLPTIRRRNIPD